MAESAKPNKLLIYLVASVILIGITIFWNLFTLSYPLPGVPYYVLAFFVAVFTCALIPFRNFRLLNVLIVIDILLMAAGIIIDILFAPPGPYM